MLHRNHIAGEWVGNDASANINPSNADDVAGEFVRTTGEGTLRVIAAAKTAYTSA